MAVQVICTAETETVAALQQRIRLLEAVIDNFPGGIILTDKNLEVLVCNTQLRQMLDYPKSLFENGNPSLRELFHFNAARGEYGSGKIDDIVNSKMELVKKRVHHVFERARPNGRILEIRGVPLPEGGFVTSYVDVTDQRSDQARIAHMASHDNLTDLPNRNLLRDRLERSLARARRGDNFAIHYIDLDRFKPVNDRHGHEAGDRLLIEVAERLRKVTREVDTVARIGGDEFVVLQDSVEKAQDAICLAERIVKSICRPFDVESKRFEIGASVGVAVAPGDGRDANELLRKADEAMYNCKTRGGSGYLLHSEAT